MEATVSDTRTTRPGVRQGLKLLLIAGCLTPLIFLFEGLLPSRENTIIDEMPQIVLTIGLFGLALTGMARIVYSLLTERKQSPLAAPEGPELVDGPVKTFTAGPQRPKTPLPNPITSSHNTPV